MPEQSAASQSSPPTIPQHSMSRLDLMRLAEKADGMRGLTDVVLVYNNNDKDHPYDVIERRNNTKGHQEILQINTDHDREFIGAPRKSIDFSTVPSLELRRMKGGSLTTKIDALFTDPAAVEKFVIPYYAKTRGAKFADELRRQYYADEKILAVVHEPSSEPGFGTQTHTVTFAMTEPERLAAAVSELLTHIAVIASES